MKMAVFTVMVVTSLIAWAGGVSPLLTQNYEQLSFVGMVCAGFVVASLLVFRTRKFDSLVDEPEIGKVFSRAHGLLLIILIVATLATFLVVFLRVSQGTAEHWQNVLLQPFALFFVYSAGWLLKKPRFANKRNKAR